MNNTRAAKFIYGIFYIIASAMFIWLIYPEIMKSVFEQDLLWFMPTIVRQTQGLSFMQLAYYLLRPCPLWFEVPSLKVYAFAIAKTFGTSTGYFIYFSILIQFCSSVLLVYLCRNLRLSSRICFLSGITYLAFFAHFHAYMWPMAFQHLIVIFFVLLGINLYLKTDSLINNRGNYRPYYILTLIVAFVSSFCRLTIIILPLMILVHILYCCENRREMLKKYNLWTPLFIIYLLFPVLIVTLGDERLKAVLKTASTFFNISGLVGIGINSIIKFAAILLLFLACIFILKLVIIRIDKRAFKKILLSFVLAVIFVAGPFLLITGGFKRLLIPYNLLAPFAGTFSSFLNPVASCLAMDSSVPYYFIGLGLNVFIFLLSLVFLGIFIRVFLSRTPGAILLFVFYPVIMLYVYLRNPVASRYFIYLSPLFSVIFASVVSYFCDLATKSFKLKAYTREIIVVALIVILCIPNLIAIKIAMFRGKLANNYMVYDYIKTAGLIKEDIGDSGAKKIKSISVNNMQPLSFMQTKEFSAYDSANYNFKFILSQVLDNHSVNIYLNQIPKDKKPEGAYFFDGNAVLKSSGRNIDDFYTFLDRGTIAIKRNDYKAASDFLDKAVSVRPFLLNYMLGRADISDLRWIYTSGDLRGFVDKISGYYGAQACEDDVKKASAVRAMMQKEIGDYIKCLFYDSFLKFADGDMQRSREIFSYIRFLDNNFDSVKRIISEDALVMANNQMHDYISHADSLWLFVRPENYTDRYVFERFLSTLVLKL